MTLMVSVETHNILGMIYKGQKKYNKASSNFNQALVYYESTRQQGENSGCLSQRWNGLPEATEV